MNREAPPPSPIERILREDYAALHVSARRSKRRNKARSRYKKALAKIKAMTADELGEEWIDTQAVAKAREAAKLKGVPKSLRPRLTTRQKDLIAKDHYHYFNLPRHEYKRIRWPEERPTPTPLYLQSIIDYKAYCRARFRLGFKHDEPTQVGDRYIVGEFVEHGFRSQLSWVYRRFVINTPAALNRQPAGDAMMAGGKHSLSRIDGKTRGFDQDYIVRSGEMAACIRCELDVDYETIEDLIEALIRCALPVLPNCVSYNLTADGKIGGAHLWFELADPVWFSRRRDANKAAQHLYRSVVAALTHRLKVIGADMAGACMPRAGKNPLGPRMHSLVLNDRAVATLAEWAEWLGPAAMKIDLTEAVREQVLERAEADGVSRWVSQRLFISARTYAWEALGVAYNAYKSDGNSALTLACRFPGSDRSPLRDLIYDALLLVADDFEAGATSDPKKLQILMSVANAVSKEWDPAKRNSRRKNSGIMKGQESFEALDNRHDRQSAGAGHTHLARRAKTVWLCVQAINRECIDPTKPGAEEQIALAAGRNPKTVTNNLENVFLALHANATSAQEVWSLLEGYSVTPHNYSTSSEQAFVVARTVGVGDADSRWNDRVVTDAKEGRPSVKFINKQLAASVMWTVHCAPGDIVIRDDVTAKPDLWYEQFNEDWTDVIVLGPDEKKDLPVFDELEELEDAPLAPVAPDELEPVPLAARSVRSDDDGKFLVKVRSSRILAGDAPGSLSELGAVSSPAGEEEGSVWGVYNPKTVVGKWSTHEDDVLERIRRIGALGFDLAA